MADEEKPQEEEKAEGGGGGLKAILIPVAASSLVTIIMFVVYILFLAPKPAPVAAEGEGGGEHAVQDGGEHGTEAVQDDGPAHVKHTGHYHQYDSFVVSIFDREKVHYLRIKVALELAKPEIASEIEAKDPQIKDSMIFVLGDFTVRELLDNQAKLLVKEVLLKTLNKILGRGKVIDVYFTEFVVQ